jgi:hypothetical protein
MAVLRCGGTESVSSALMIASDGCDDQNFRRYEINSVGLRKFACHSPIENHRLSHQTSVTTLSIVSAQFVEEDDIHVWTQRGYPSRRSAAARTAAISSPSNGCHRITVGKCMSVTKDYSRLHRVDGGLGGSWHRRTFHVLTGSAVWVDLPINRTPIPA